MIYDNYINKQLYYRGEGALIKKIKQNHDEFEVIVEINGRKRTFIKATKERLELFLDSFTENKIFNTDTMATTEIKNNKDIYRELGEIAIAAKKQLAKKYTDETAQTSTKALLGQMRVFEAEVMAANVSVKIDAHNRKHGSDIEIRKVEQENFK